jgi:hypothetical protein
VPPLLITQLFRLLLSMIDRWADFLLVSRALPWLETLAKLRYLCIACVVSCSLVALEISFLDCWYLRSSVFCWMLPLPSQSPLVLLAALGNCIRSWLFWGALWILSWKYVMVPHALGRDFCWFSLVWCLNFVSRDIW